MIVIDMLLLQIMVEGPGCKLKGEKLKATALGQRVVNVSGNVIDNRPKKDQEKQTPFHKLLDNKITDVRTLGKELFVFFDQDFCLRIHFLMSGYVRSSLSTKSLLDAIASLDLGYEREGVSE